MTWRGRTVSPEELSIVPGEFRSARFKSLRRM